MKKKIVRLTESDLVRIVKRVLNEGAGDMSEINSFNFPEWLSNYGFKRKHVVDGGIDVITYTDGSEQLVFKVKNMGQGKYSNVYVGASGSIIGNLMSNYKGKQYPLGEMKGLFDEIARDVLLPYEEIKKNGYNVVSKVDLPNGNYTLEGSGSVGQIMSNGKPTNFYLLFKERVRGSIDGNVVVNNGMVKGGENYGGILAMLRK